MLAGIFTARTFPWQGVTLVATFLVLWTLAEAMRRDEQRHFQAQDYLDLAASDFIKLVLSLSMWLLCRQLQTVPSLSSFLSETPSDTYNLLPFQEHEHADFCVPEECPGGQELYPRPIVTLTLENMRSALPIFVVGLVYALWVYTDLRTREFVDPFTLHLAFPVTVLGVLTIFHSIPWRHFPSSFWHAAILQFGGFFIAKDALLGSELPAYDLLLAFALCGAIWITLVDVIYGLYRSSSVHLINTVIFTLSCLVHSLLFLFLPSHGTSYLHYDYYTTASAAFQALPLIEAVKSILATLIIHQYGAISLAALATLLSTLFIVVDTWKFTESPYSGSVGCLIAVLGSGIFIFCGQQHMDERRHEFSVSGRRYFAAAMVSLVALGYVVVVITQNPWGWSSELSSAWRKLFGLSKDSSDCRVPESPTLTHAQTITDYTYFSNVLLIVFFSHPRYEANLDFHREVYADYFPNIIYIGPATREDKGFAHSYDVFVDSFQSDEDLSDPLNYKMAGRMAHHMLYTALREYGCYDGYLWVPFDTLLNVPRLQQFNQSLFWYHSPWGQPVPNPAFGDHAEPGLNISRHAPPAMISPDTSINLTETWRGWGPDWWWGDPHVGVSVCMNAFHKVPADMRDHLARLTNGQTRLIGGSADTLYIPGRHRRVFMDILALFLETDCFLEIATPTTVHLVLPPGEPIQFVDHWWIYQPPFNASFVRQKWTEGYEVDTFHTFHWGERGEDGVWRGDHGHVADVRHLQRESAIRQGLGETFPVNLGDDHGTMHV